MDPKESFMKTIRSASSNAWRLAGALALLAPAAARADVIGPDEAACQGRSVGAMCITNAGGAGTCQERRLPVPRPDASETRMAIVCVADGDASAPTDSGVGSEPPPAGGCRCAVLATPFASGGASVAWFAVAAGWIAARRARHSSRRASTATRSR
jgi:hypothetical protein